MQAKEVMEVVFVYFLTFMRGRGSCHLSSTEYGSRFRSLLAFKLSQSGF